MRREACSVKVLSLWPLQLQYFGYQNLWCLLCVLMHAPVLADDSSLTPWTIPQMTLSFAIARNVADFLKFCIFLLGHVHRGHFDLPLA